jgi:hypothetical protein
MGQTGHHIYGATPKIHTKEAIRSELAGDAGIEAWIRGEPAAPKSDPICPPLQKRE